MIERVTLGYDEIDPAGLTGEGVAWSQVVPRDVDDRIAGFVREQLPTAGWRELAVEPPSGRRVFAAPHRGGWALAHVSDGSILSADPGPFSPRPGKSARRAGLALKLHPLQNGSDGLWATLTNTSKQLWVADPQDSGYCHAWVLDSDGARRGSSAFAYASPQAQLEDLLPGQSLRLPVQIEGSGKLAPEEHRLEVVLPSLDLFATGTVEIR